MAQALRAAAYTIPEDRPVHSLHGYFLRPGDPKIPALIDVERIRDGRSFSTRRVVVIQHGQAIFNMDASFQIAEPGLTHQLPMPERQPPTGHGAGRRCATGRFSAGATITNGCHPAKRSRPARISGSRRTAGCRTIRCCTPAWPSYESDNALLGTARLPHRDVMNRERMQMASLDHAMWFHHGAVTDWRVDEWMLYSLDAPSSSQARGYNRGLIYSADGKLVATTMQEGLMRQR